MTEEEYLHLTDGDLSINSNYYIHSCTGEKGLIVSSDDKGVILYNKDRGTKFHMSIEILNKFWTPITEDEYKDTNFGLQDAIKGRHDNVNHPSHYTWLKNLCGIEVIDITRHMDFNLGNSIKYILRSGHKKEEGYTDKQKTIEDLKKAVWYLNDEINMLQ